MIFDLGFRFEGRAPRLARHIFHEEDGDALLVRMTTGSFRDNGFHGENWMSVPANRLGLSYSDVSPVDRSAAAVTSVSS